VAEAWELVTSRPELWAFTEPGAGKTAVHLHLEKLSDAGARKAMRERWDEAMDRVAEAAS
jgi:hypothetical protein